MDSNFQRKYVELIHRVTSKWANWDPPIPVEVGTYGKVDSNTGALNVEGNIYSAEFQLELDRLGIPLHLVDHPPQDSPAEEDFIIATKGARRVDVHLSPQAGVAGIASASITGQWRFEHGRRDALLIMRAPRLRFLPNNVVLDKLYKVPLLENRWLVTSVHLCPAFSMYLSDKSGETVSLALSAQAPIAGVAGVTAGGDVGFGWSSDRQTNLLRKACDKRGEYSFTPLYSLKRRVGWVQSLPLMQRIFRGEDQDEVKTGDDLWEDALPPWPPLDEDGEEDAIDVQEYPTSPTDDDD